jgi:hypothetical protein
VGTLYLRGGSGGKLKVEEGQLRMRGVAASRADDYADVMSGIFYGWLNNNAALAMQMRVGDGKAFVTTFRFNAYGSDPYPTRLLDVMIRYASGSDFAPKLALP